MRERRGEGCALGFERGEEGRQGCQLVFDRSDLESPNTGQKGKTQSMRGFLGRQLEGSLLLGREEGSGGSRRVAARVRREGREVKRTSLSNPASCPNPFCLSTNALLNVLSAASPSKTLLFFFFLPAPGAVPAAPLAPREGPASGDVEEERVAGPWTREGSIKTDVDRGGGRREGGWWGREETVLVISMSDSSSSSSCSAACLFWPPVVR